MRIIVVVNLVTAFARAN